MPARSGIGSASVSIDVDRNGVIDASDPVWHTVDGPDPIASLTYELVPADFDRYTNLRVELSGHPQRSMMLALCDTDDYTGPCQRVSWTAPSVDYALSSSVQRIFVWFPGLGGSSVPSAGERLFVGTPGVAPCASIPGGTGCTLTDDDFSPLGG